MSPRTLIFRSTGHALWSEREDFLFGATLGAQGVRPTDTSQALPYTGHYVMRSDWSEKAVYLLFGSSLFGYGHQHEFVRPDYFVLRDTLEPSDNAEHEYTILFHLAALAQPGGKDLPHPGCRACGRRRLRPLRRRASANSRIRSSGYPFAIVREKHMSSNGSLTLGFTALSLFGLCHVGYHFYHL